jgi:hypothetical protein
MNANLNTVIGETELTVLELETVSGGSQEIFLNLDNDVASRGLQKAGENPLEFS